MTLPVIPLVLAGGKGERLFPISTPESPKFLIEIYGEPLIRRTLNRISKIHTHEKICIITNSKVIPKIEPLRREFELEILIEPSPKNTLPAVLYTLKHLEKEFENFILCVFPSDHIIEDSNKFLESVSMGCDLARQGFIVTFGIKPHSPETGYGYIKRGDPIPGFEKKGFFAEKFVEKPSKELAEEFLRLGTYYWNSGIFIFTKETLIGELKTLNEKFYQLYMSLNPSDNEAILKFYEDSPDISIDYGIMEKSSKIAVLETDFYWDDIGNYLSLSKYLKQLDEDNYIFGNAVPVESSGNIIISGDNGLIMTFGIKDLIISQKNNITIVIPKKYAQFVRTLSRLFSEKFYDKV